MGFGLASMGFGLASMGFGLASMGFGLASMGFPAPQGMCASTAGPSGQSGTPPPL
jgi:hypothetical protein